MSTYRVEFVSSALMSPMWCWRLKIPMVWLERRTPCSRYGRVQLEMFTSANRLTAGGLAGMKAICAPANAAAWTRVSPHDACWDHVARPNARELAHTVFRAATRPRNYEKNEGGTISGHGLKMVRMA